MCKRGHRNRGRLNLIAGEQLLDGAEGARAILAGEGIGASRFSVHDRGQLDRLTLLRELVVNAGMVASEGAHADDGDVNWVVSGQWSVPRWQ